MIGIDHSNASDISNWKQLFLNGLKGSLQQMVTTLFHVRAGNEGNDPDQDDADNGGTDLGVVTRVKPKTKKPSMYKVLMLNDDYTPMEFVIHVLQRFFAMGSDQATQIMLHVHHRGVGVCGVFTYEIAETKVNQVMDLARQQQHPLQCTIEKDDGEGEGGH